MADFPLIVSYYTKDTLYQLEVQNLIASCKRWNLLHHIESISSFGSWERNCAYKPFFLMEKLQQFRKPLFWVDADAAFLQEPGRLEAFKTDFAARINHACEDTHPSKIYSGSLFINATQGAERLLKAWGQACIQALTDPHRTHEFWDQMALRDVIQQGIPNTTIGELPPEYVTIIDHPHDPQDNTVIAHYQASRRFKKMVNSSGENNLEN